MNVEYQELINVTLWQKGSKWHSLPKFVCVCLCNFLIINSGLYALSLNSYFQLCCDLLEKSYFCSIANNFLWDSHSCLVLWFAWKIVLLQYRKQRKPRVHCRLYVVICLKNRTFAVSQTTRFVQTYLRSCCDLLEKSYFCSIANNVHRTNITPSMLWFAWKIVLLQYRKQLVHILLIEVTVVICLKNRTFAVSQTTLTRKTKERKGLWFAWKIVLLQYRKQLHNCSIRLRYVVICLKNRTFAVSQTT